MAKNRLVWSPVPAQEDGQKVYRDLSPIDSGNLPSPIGELFPDDSVFEDDTADGGTSYHYAIGSFADNDVKIGSSVEVSAVESLPRFVTATRMTSSDSRASITVTIPDHKAGDVLVAFGLRRAPIATPSGWTSAGTVPNPGSGAGFNQWTYCFWKVSDGTEESVTVAYSPAATERLTLSVAIIRHDTKPVSVSTLGLVRHPTGGANSVSHSVTNGAQRALLLVVTSWIYASTSGVTFVENWSPRAWAFDYLRMDTGQWGQLRYLGFFTEADQNEAVTINRNIDADNSADSLSDIWLAFTV